MRKILYLSFIIIATINCILSVLLICDKNYSFVMTATLTINIIYIIVFSKELNNLMKKND